MVTLFVRDSEQITILEYELIKANIPYDTIVKESNMGISSPSISVYGVPLDEKRAMKWIKEQCCKGGGYI